MKITKLKCLSLAGLELTIDIGKIAKLHSFYITTILNTRQLAAIFVLANLDLKQGIG